VMMSLGKRVGTEWIMHVKSTPNVEKCNGNCTG